MAHALEKVLQHVRALAIGQRATDGDLLRAFTAANDQAAFTALTRRHGPLVLAVCRRIAGNQEDAEDAFQATFVVLARKAAKLAVKTSLSSWLHGVAYRVALNGRRLAARRRRHERQAKIMSGANPAWEAAWHEVQGILDEEIQRLPEKYREPFILCCLENQSSAVAARRMNLKEGTVRSRISEARKRLQKRLSRRGVDLTAVLATVALSEHPTSAAVLVAKTVSVVTAKSSALPRSVAALVSATSRTLILARAKVTVAIVLAVGATMGVAGVGAYRAAEADAARRPVSRDALAERGKAADARQTEGVRKKALVDNYGDPLPEEAVARLGTVRFWSGGGSQVIYTSDGKRLFVSNWDIVMVYDAKSGKRLGTIRPKNNLGVNCMSITADGKHLAVGTTRRDHKIPESIRVFDVSTRSMLCECIEKGDQQYLNVRFSPDGSVLASYSFPAKAIYLWDATTGKTLRRWPVKDSFACFTFTPDGKLLVEGDGNSIYFRDIATGVEIRRIHGHRGAVRRIAISQDGKTLASQGMALKSDPGDPSRENIICLCDAVTGKKLREIEAKPEGDNKEVPRFTHFKFLNDGKTLVTTNKDGMIRTWEVHTGKQLARWTTGEFCWKFDISPNGKTIAVLGSGNCVRFWDMKTGLESNGHPGHRHGFRVLAVSPDSKMIASGNRSDVRLWGANTGRQQRLFTLKTDLRDFHFSQDGRTLVTLGGDNLVTYWDIASSKSVAHFPAPLDGKYGLNASSTDGKICAGVYETRKSDVIKIVLWEAATGKKLRELHRDNWWIGALGFSPDNRMVYSYSGEHRVFLWDAQTGKIARSFPIVPKGGVYTGRFSRDGKWFACGDREGHLLLYDMSTGKEVRRLALLPEMGVFRPSLEFAPDGRTLAVGMPDGIIYLLELATGKIRYELRGGHQDEVWALVFTRDGRRLISGSSDTTALVWDLTGSIRSKANRQSEADLGHFWADLQSADAGRAYEAVRRMSAAPSETVPFLKLHLRPSRAPDEKHVNSLIADLGSNVFSRREKAMKSLGDFAELVESALRRGQDQAHNLEARRRIAQLLARLETIGESGEHLRQTRALEALENIATPEAQAVLRTLAAGAPGARETEEAKASLERLKRSIQP